MRSFIFTTDFLMTDVYFNSIIKHQSMNTYGPKQLTQVLTYL